MDNRLSFLFDQSNDFFCVSDKMGTLLKTNTAFQHVLGYSAEDLLETNLIDLSHPADKKREQQLLRDLNLYHEIAGYENRMKAKNGRYYSITWSAALNKSDDLIYFSGTNLADISFANNSNNNIDNIQHTIQSFNEGFIIIDENWKITSYNPAFQAISGLSQEQLQNINFRQVYSLGLTEDIMLEFEAAFNGLISSQLQYFNIYYNRWLRVNIYPYKSEHTIFIRDITSIRIQQLILALEKKVLELNATESTTLGQTTAELLKGIEEIFPDMICSVLEVEQGKLRHLSGPRLPAEYCDLINGSSIGPKAGSCGTAAYHRMQIIVSDIETDPLWEDYKELARPFGLKACWSTPIISSDGKQVLATFALYYKNTRQPKPAELQMIERTVNILRILIENKRNENHVKNQNKRLQEIAAISSHEIRRPVATILGLLNLFDRNNLANPMNQEIISHLDISAQELDSVIHTIVKKTHSI